MIGGKHKGEEDDSLASLWKNGKGSEMAKLSGSIEKHGESLLAIVKLAPCNKKRTVVMHMWILPAQQLILFVMQRGI